MNDMSFYTWGQSVPVCVVHARWSGGAQEGKYHVYLSGDGRRGTDGPFEATPFDRGYQCVVDDFGNLRRVS